MEPPPGLVYLAQVLPVTLLPSVLTYVFLARILPLLGVVAPLPLWSCLLAAVVAQPAGVIIGHLFTEWRYARDAASRGAVHIPEIPDTWPGGLSLLAEIRKSSYPGDFLLDWCDRWGNTIVAKLLFDRAIFTLEPEYIKAVLATDFDNYWKGTDANGLGHSLLGFGMFHRTMSRPFFNKERISDFDTFDKHTRDALARVQERLTEGYAVDIQDCVSRFTLDSATAFLFGQSVDSLGAGLPYPYSAPSYLANSPAFLNHPSNTYVRAFTQGQLLMLDRAAFGRKWPLSEFWADRVKPQRKVADAYVEGIIERALAEAALKKRAEYIKPDRGQEKQETFLSHLVEATDDKEVIRDSIFNILVAGRDTTAATLTFAVYMLAEHSDVAARLRKEVLAVVGNARMPTYDDVRGMKYLRAFINETLRLYPPVPFDSRTSKNAAVWPPLRPGDKPLYVTPNTKVRYSVFLMHRRTDLWGPDALQFDPDRFLDERLKKYLTPNPFIFLPFNAGPRICLGQQFAYNEASFFLIRLLQKFSDFELAPDAQPESTKPPASWKEAKGTQATEKIMLNRHLTMFAQGGLWVRMRPVSGDPE
ncbi:cytochrome P450 monooxygenase pc-3 [Mycena olivaceomarginata]|nr:cytochrome P450 monooxygenase pc-3 [Mycena olivaceomarginata]